MSRQFLRHRSGLARQVATRNVETAVQQMANLVLNASALADRMEAEPLRDLADAPARRARVKVLRDAVRAGQAAIRRATADLEPARDRAADEGRLY